MKNILLMFLSDGVRPESKYKIGADKIVQTRHSNESAVYELAQTCKIDMIFAFTSKRVMESNIDIDNKKQNTLEYFRQRVARIVAPENILECYYDEAKNMNDALAEVAAMAKMILAKRNEYADEEYILHADMTGGMRNASMMMLGVMRLLEYSQIKMGRVLYSNWEKGRVEDSADVYRFFDLVAGAKEFVHYGSIRELKAYFANETEKSAELKGLLSAMENFSESIKLCRYGEFTEAIRELDEKIKAFLQRSDTQRYVNDSLFSTILPIIQKSYEPLLASNNDDLAIIKWCAERGYLQQAMTLYTERVPEFIFAKGLLTVADGKWGEIEKKYNDFCKDRVGSFNYYIIAAYAQPSGNHKLRGIKKDFVKGLKEYFGNYGPDFEKIEKELDKVSDQKREDCIISWNKQLLELLKAWQAALENLDEELAARIQENYLFEKFLESKKGKSEGVFDKRAFKDFLNYINKNVSQADLEKAFAIRLDPADKYRAKMPRLAMKEKLDKKFLVCANGIEDSLLDAIDDYNWVRNIRNSSNHARNDEEYVRPSDVKKRILEACDRLKKIEAKLLELAKKDNLPVYKVKRVD